MRRALLVVAVAVSVGALHQLAWGATGQSAYKPAERRRQEQEKEAQKAKDAQEPSDTTYEQELQAAKEKRDKDLQDAASNETSPRTLEKRKQEIFAQYASILAALRDKYEEAHPEDAKATTQKPGKGKVGRNKPGDQDQAADDGDKPGRSKNRKKGREPADLLAEAQKDLDDENDRHQTTLDDLNNQLKDAQSSNNVRNVRKFEKAIDKENNSYAARKKILERRVRDLGGTPTPPPVPAPAPAPKAGDKPA